MSKTISPFLIKLTMTHKMEYVSSAAFVSVTWDVIWILLTLTFFLQSTHERTNVLGIPHKGTPWMGPRMAHDLLKDTRQGGVDFKLFQIDLVGLL